MVYRKQLSRYCRRHQRVYAGAVVPSVKGLVCVEFAYYAPDRREGAVSVVFVRPSVCPSVAYMPNNSRTQRHSVSTFGRKVPHLRCDWQTSFKVKRSKVRVRGGRGHTVSAEPGGHTAYCGREKLRRVDAMLLHATVGSVRPWGYDSMSSGRCGLAPVLVSLCVYGVTSTGSSDGVSTLHASPLVGGTCSRAVAWKPSVNRN